MSDRPNLLFVLSDQHRWCDLGCYGNSAVGSPNFDALAASGLRFETCVSNTPLCVPARSSLLTGQLGMRHRAITNDLPIDTGVQSIAHVLAGAGYRTGYIGKWHLAGVPRDREIPAGPGRLGFEAWKVFNCSHEYFHAEYRDESGQRHRHEGYEPEGQTDLAIEFIESASNDPWALYLSWGPPHDPYHTAPQDYLSRYDPAEVVLRPNVPDVILHDMSTQVSHDDIRRDLAGYYAHITALDDQLARLTEALDRTGQKENTIVVYTSDHGDMLGSQGLTRKEHPYEESIRVPLLISWPGMVRTETTPELVGLVDLPVTLLGLLDLSFDGDVAGRDLSPVLLDPAARGHDACYISSLVPSPSRQAVAREWRGIRTRQYTYARTASDEGYLLYDNHTDPYQQINLIDDPAFESVRAVLRGRLDNLIERHDELLPWEEFIRRHDFTEEWNRSQAYFGVPLL